MFASTKYLLDEALRVSNAIRTQSNYKTLVAQVIKANCDEAFRES